MRTRAERRRGGARLWIPFAIYVAVTCVLPLARHADRRDGFWEHAAMTLLLPAAMMLAWIAARRVRAALREGVRRTGRGA